MNYVQELCYPKENREVLVYEVSLHYYLKLYFYPAKFDNFKDEKMSDCKSQLLKAKTCWTKNLLV